MKYKTSFYNNKPSNRHEMQSHRPKSSIKYTTEHLMASKAHDISSPGLAANSEIGLTDSQGISYSSKKRFRKAYGVYKGGKTLDYRANEPSVASKDAKTNNSRNRNGISKTSNKSQLYFSKKTRYGIKMGINHFIASMNDRKSF